MTNGLNCFSVYISSRAIRSLLVQSNDSFVFDTGSITPKCGLFRILFIIYE